MSDTDHHWHERVEPDSPLRCQAIGAGGDQCRFRRSEHSNKCRIHGGAQADARAQRAAVSAYNLQRWKADVERHGNHQRVFVLRDEIGILRTTLEALLNRCRSEDDLVLNAAKVAHLVNQVRDTLKVGKQLESAIGELMDRETISKLCDEVVAAVAGEVPAEALDRISSRVAAAIGRAVASGRME